MDSSLILTSVTKPVALAAGPQTGSPRTDSPRQALPQCPPLSYLFSPLPLLSPPPPMLPHTWTLATASSSTPCSQPLPLKSVLTQSPAFYCVHKFVHCSAPTNDSSDLGPHLASPSPAPPSLFTLPKSPVPIASALGSSQRAPTAGALVRVGWSGPTVS